MSLAVDPGPQAARVFAPDPLDFGAGDVERPTIARPRLLVALLGVAGLVASVAFIAPMLGVAQAKPIPILDAVWLAPALLAAAIACAFVDQRRIWGAPALLLLAAMVAALGVTAFDLIARAIFNNMMDGNDIAFRLAGYASPLAVAALAISALAWLMLTCAALASRQPA